MTSQLLQFLALFMLMLVTGIFWGPWFSLHRSLNVFNADEFIHIVKTLAGNLSTPMKIMMPLCLLFMFLSGWLYPQKESLGFYLNLLASLLSINSLIITLAVEVPIVNQIRAWKADTIPENWEVIRNRWLKFHVVRTFSSLMSFASLASSFLLLQ